MHVKRILDMARKDLDDEELEDEKEILKMVPFKAKKTSPWATSGKTVSNHRLKASFLYQVGAARKN